jgi:hypothetical protein
VHIKCLIKSIIPVNERMFQIFDDVILLYFLYPLQNECYLLKRKLKNADSIVIETKIVISKDAKQYYLLVEEFWPKRTIFR